MNGGHKTVGDTELVVQDLGDGSQAVGGARCVRNDLLACIGIGVDTANEHRGSVLRGSRHYDVLCTGSDVSLSLLLGEEQTRRLDNILGTYLVPLQVCGILLGQIGGVTLSKHGDGLAVDHDVVALGIDVAVELAVHGVVLEHVSQVIHGAKVVDAHYIVLVSLSASCTEYHTADTSETVDTNLNLCHNSVCFYYR